MKSNFSKLPDFVAKVGDFAALSSATNLSKILVKSSYGHVEGLKQKKEVESPTELGESRQPVSKAVKSFIANFWCKFG